MSANTGNKTWAGAAKTELKPARFETLSVGLVGARGYVGIELLEIIGSHPLLDLEYASSRLFEGARISEHAKVSFGGQKFEHITSENVVERSADIVILALPDAAATPFIDAIEACPKNPRLIVDLSADKRFTNDWVYGLPEHNAAALRSATRISNPGCYATAAQLVLRPLLPLLTETPHCFGVSGYSGAGKNRSDRNDHRALANGVLPYKLVNHTHEREIATHLDANVRFSPHVAPFFRGIAMTVQVRLSEYTSAAALRELYIAAYHDHPLIEITGEDTPRVQEIVGRDGAEIGGFSVNPERPDEVAMVCTIDNLRKGAASQAIQNINLTQGFGELTGLSTGFKENGE
ncbi:MAG: N-acetyl-gamma-glutamyl-phosphate reductase [Phycisphaera sp.]|nr:MAG: N-acetyl-gamma-glutamyl-phosphate reductase [Phycisphaera sp.]